MGKCDGFNFIWRLGKRASLPLLPCSSRPTDRSRDVGHASMLAASVRCGQRSRDRNRLTYARRTWARTGWVRRQSAGGHQSEFDKLGASREQCAGLSGPSQRQDKEAGVVVNQASFQIRSHARATCKFDAAIHIGAGVTGPACRKAGPDYDGPWG